MINKLLGLAVALTLPTIAAAQTPHRSTRRRGEVVAVAPTTRGPHATTPVIGPTPAVPGHGFVATVPATRANPAIRGGQSDNHRP